MALPAVMSDPPMALLASSICEAGFPGVAGAHSRRKGEMLLAIAHAAALQGRRDPMADSSRNGRGTTMEDVPNNRTTFYIACQRLEAC